MLLRKPAFIVLVTFLWANGSGLFCLAERAELVSPVHYRFGDDPQWANPNFDDTSWLVAQHGSWLLPPFDSDGHVWVRETLRVTNDASGALALRISGRNSALIADEVYVNGVLVGRQGRLPPNAVPIAFGKDVVFDLPEGAARSGATAVVAFRAWYSPGLRPTSRPDNALFVIGESENLHLAEHAAHSDLMIEMGPDLVLNGIVFVLGAGLLVFWRVAGGRDLLVCSWMLIGASLMSLWGESVRLGLLPVPLWAYSSVYVGLQALSMAGTVELVWTVHHLRAVGLRRLYHASWVISSATYLILNLAVNPSPIVFWSKPVMMLGLLSFDLIQLAVNLWALIARRTNRLIAMALLAIPLADLLQNYGHLRAFHIGVFRESYFGLSLFVCEFALFVMLGERGWRAWRTRDELRVEFDAAREVQQKSVAQAAEVRGFRIESVYAPARQVGGDFFRVLPETDGGALIVIGDVSGKGLKAAMTVSAIMGALRVCPSESPGEILSYLNRVVYGHAGVFVTCSVALIQTDGTMTLANAGHPAPYRNGEEMDVEPGLPLGILPENQYAVLRYEISADDHLTFISDGVLEATNEEGELYGFARTQVISNQPASSIAEDAIRFGQQDDITVLSITLEPSPKPVLELAGLEKPVACTIGEDPIATHGN